MALSVPVRPEYDRPVAPAEQLAEPDTMAASEKRMQFSPLLDRKSWKFL
jgi:hypothetical protein